LPVSSGRSSTITTVKPRPLPFKFLAIHDSPFVTPFGAVWPETVDNKIRLCVRRVAFVGLLKSQPLTLKIFLFDMPLMRLVGGPQSDKASCSWWWRCQSCQVFAWRWGMSGCRLGVVAVRPRVEHPALERRFSGKAGRAFVNRWFLFWYTMNVYLVTSVRKGICLRHTRGYNNYSWLYSWKSFLVRSRVSCYININWSCS
jgi:hypothetical protein